MSRSERPTGASEPSPAAILANLRPAQVSGLAEVAKDAPLAPEVRAELIRESRLPPAALREDVLELAAEVSPPPRSERSADSRTDREVVGGGH